MRETRIEGKGIGQTFVGGKVTSPAIKEKNGVGGGGRGAYRFPGAAITKSHTLGSLNNRKLCYHGSGGWKSKIKVSTGLVSPEASLFDCGQSSSCLHTVFPLPVCVRISSS
jgi:hypothetical protein